MNYEKAWEQLKEYLQIAYDDHEPQDNAVAAQKAKVYKEILDEMESYSSPA